MSAAPALLPPRLSPFSELSVTAGKPIPQQDDHYFHEIVDEPARSFVQIIVNISRESIKNAQKGIDRDYAFTVESCSQQYMLKLSWRNIVRYTYGFEIGLNKGNAAIICDDKVAASGVLGSHKPFPVPHIEHRIFFAPGKNGAESSWDKIIDYAKAYNFNVVCKVKSGSGGNDVFHVTSQPELEKIAQLLFSKNRDFCMCPYKLIKREIRVIVLDGQALVAFEKVRPVIVGDGVNTIAQLIMQRSLKEKSANILDIFSKMKKEMKEQSFDEIPPNGQMVSLSWKHNLAQGASAELIDIPKDYLEVPSNWSATQDASAPSSQSSIKLTPNEIREIISLAKRAAQVAQVTFGSMDVAVIEGESPMIMEMNSGVMMENLVLQLGSLGESIATSVYKKAINLLFAQAEHENYREYPASSTESSSGTPMSSSPPSNSPLTSPSIAPQVSPISEPQPAPKVLAKFRPSQIPLYNRNLKA